MFYVRQPYYDTKHNSMMMTQATVQYIILTMFYKSMNFDKLQNMSTCRQRTVFQ